MHFDQILAIFISSSSHELFNYFSFCFLFWFFWDNRNFYVGFPYFDAFKLFIHFHFACSFYSYEKCVLAFAQFFFCSYSALYSCFYKMMASLSLFKFMFLIFINFVAAFVSCHVHLLFVLFCSFSFLMLHIYRSISHSF